MSGNKLLRMDDDDRRILCIVYKNVNLGISDIAKQISCEYDFVHYRVKTLCNYGYIDVQTSRGKTKLRVTQRGHEAIEGGDLVAS